MTMNCARRFLVVVQRSPWSCLRSLNTSMSGENTVKEAKASLRKEIKGKLSTLTTEEVERQSKQVLEKLFKNERFAKSKRVSVYLSMEHEIQTDEILKYLFANNKECFIPKYRVGGAIMDMVPLSSWDDYEKLPVTKWNIKQPAASDLRPDALETGGLDVVISPGLAFTKEGKRLGHGRGYYDSYLARCIKHTNGKPFYVGLALREQVVSDVPVGPSDVPLDLVITSDT